MSEETAKLIIAAGGAIGVVAWFAALQLYRKMAATPAVETLETPVSEKSPTEAMKAVVERVGQLAFQTQLARPAENVFEITQFGCHTRIEARRIGGQTLLVAEFSDAALRRKWQWVFALFVVLLMPLTIVGVTFALWHFAAPNAASGIRWQCVQILQTVHVLWPPFLFYGLWKQMRKGARDAVSNLLVLAQA